VLADRDVVGNALERALDGQPASFESLKSIQVSPGDMEVSDAKDLRDHLVNLLAGRRGFVSP